MIKAEFLNHVRFLFNDSALSNSIQRESLVERPGNVIDGINKIFLLRNRRIASATIYDDDNVALVAGADYTIDLPSGKIVFVDSPERNFYADYF